MKLYGEFTGNISGRIKKNQELVEQIKSKVQSGKTLHMIHRKKEFNRSRRDLISTDQFLQCSSLKLTKNQTFRPHQHIWKTGTHKHIAQESWVVVEGRVLCKYYDIDGKLLAEEIIEKGDASFTLEGGHTYIALCDDTMVYEFKNGPYEGQAKDKVFL